MACEAALSAEPTPHARYRIDQPVQPLADALRAIAAKTGVSVLFDPVAVGDRQSRPVNGQLTAAEAITRAVQGSGLQAIVMPDGSIVVRGAAPVEGAASRPVSALAAGAAGGADAVSGLPASLGGASATASGGASSRTLVGASGASGAGKNAANPAAVGAEGVTSLSRVEVTGSRLKRIDADGPAPVNVYTKVDIDRSGQPTLERFISSLNEASVSPGEGGLGETTGQGSVQLRGLPLGSTLVLINGRRVQAVGSSSGNFFNLNLIPMAAVERVEIVPVGSSAVYGGDALAGVVNIILRKSLEGVALDAHASTGAGTGDRGLSLATGGRSELGSYLLLGAYSKTTPLTMAERGFFRDADYRRFGGIDARSRSCSPGTVTSATGANLPGLNSSFAGIPVLGEGVVPTVGSFAPTSGLANLCNGAANGHGTALVHGTENFALHAAGERQFGAAWTVFGELTVARDRLRAEQSGLLLSNVLVPASNPYNPFGEAVRVTSRLGAENGAETFTRNTDFKRALVGSRVELGGGWDAEASVSTTRDDGDRRIANTVVNSAARTAALAAATPGAALNPFGSGRAASDEVLRGIWSDSLRDNHGRKDQFSAFVRGPVVTLPTGTVDLIAGAEGARDRYLTITPGTYDIGGSRTNSAVYGEARVPLWRAPAQEGSSRPGHDAAVLTLAARRDHYSDFGSAGTYQAGLEVRPTRTTLLRASTATSFKPPTLLQTHINEETYTTDVLGLVDPARANAPIMGGEVLRTTNPDLEPEKGRAYALGAVWEPDGGAGSVGTRVAVTGWRVKINDLISLPWPQVFLDNEALFPGFVTRGPTVGGVPGEVTRVLATEVNFGGVDTSGVDMELSHAWRAAGAKWTLTASATRTTRYEVVIAPNAPVEDRLARRATDYWSPKWKGRLFAGMDQGGWSLGVTGRYLGSYRDLAPSERTLGNRWLYDLAATVDLRRAGVQVPGVKTAQVALSIVNLGNQMPEFVAASPYYDLTQGDWRGRFANLHVSMNW
ncbi:MAG: TonB-dependent receptor [Rubrivivax sp.]|nr:MAG: TonB-dependent receptor [Rubrivivax sp.]